MAGLVIKMQISVIYAVLLLLCGTSPATSFVCVHDAVPRLYHPLVGSSRILSCRQSSRVHRSILPSLSMSVEGDFDPDAISKAKQEIDAGSFKARLRALYKFTRPHTIRGTILASIAGTVRALIDTPGAINSAQWGSMLPRAFVGMLALLLGNAFIVGINQIYDKEIDEMNKPFLPVASGEMSKRSAWVTVLTSLVVGPTLVYALFPPLLFRLYCFGLFLGGIYSVPPIRTKKNPLLAGLTIATVRGFLLNFGVYYAVKDAIGAPFTWSPKVSFIARFMTIYATVIAVTKDLPDVEGDKAYQIDTFATRVGVKRIAQGATFFLFANYVQAVATGLLAPAGTFRMVTMIGGHMALAGVLLFRYKELNPDSMASIKRYYKHIWDLFYLEYGLYTLI
ncbi:tocopherol phytyltransferase [Nitzschia inconspicua]|uniref:Tocopherol phytyltransferase n=1 Tax=Nitzschia inconspicua TaxID=303405 RepID=A0A9K3KNM1_9STRA|nr:tocopherol phytyltransferase [Nitzschia inconspicua]